MHREDGVYGLQLTNYFTLHHHVYPQAVFKTDSIVHDRNGFLSLES